MPSGAEHAFQETSGTRQCNARFAQVLWQASSQQQVEELIEDHLQACYAPLEAVPAQQQQAPSLLSSHPPGCPPPDVGPLRIMEVVSRCYWDEFVSG